MSNNIKYDSLTCMQRLRATGIPQNQAEAITDLITEVRSLSATATMTKQLPKEFDTWEQFKRLRATGLPDAQAEAFLGEVIIAFWGFVPNFYKDVFQKFNDAATPGRKEKIAEFRQFREQVSKEAAARGLTEEKLNEILVSDS